MEIKKTAMAGTLESSDVQVTIEPSENGIEILLESSVMRQFGRQIRAVVKETLERLEVTNARVALVDKRRPGLHHKSPRGVCRVPRLRKDRKLPVGRCHPMSHPNKKD